MKKPKGKDGDWPGKKPGSRAVKARKGKKCSKCGKAMGKCTCKGY